MHPANLLCRRYLLFSINSVPLFSPGNNMHWNTLFTLSHEKMGKKMDMVHWIMVYQVMVHWVMVYWVVVHWIMVHRVMALLPKLQWPSGVTKYSFFMGIKSAVSVYKTADLIPVTKLYLVTSEGHCNLGGSGHGQTRTIYTKFYQNRSITSKTTLWGGEALRV